MAKYNSSGWHFQSQRHSNARRTGRAGGQYASDKGLKKINFSQTKGKLLIGHTEKYDIYEDKKGNLFRYEPAIFISEPFGLPRELQPTGKYKNMKEGDGRKANPQPLYAGNRLIGYFNIAGFKKIRR